MNLLPPSPSGNGHRRGKSASGFTLVELLVSITIVVVMVLLFAQMLATTSQAWVYGHGRANNFTKARAMLELLAQDIQSGIFRPDVAAFPYNSGTSTTTLEFYTGRPGIPASSSDPLRNVSAVQYAFTVPTNTSGIITNSLSRADSPILWSNSATTLIFNNTASPFPTPLTSRDTAQGVIAFDIIFIQSDGSFSTQYTPISTNGITNATPTRAISVSLAVIDDITLPKLSSSQLSALNTLLTSTGVTPNPPLRSVKSYWDGYLNSPSMNWSSYPKGLGSGMATFERYISLPNAP